MCNLKRSCQNPYYQKYNLIPVLCDTFANGTSTERCYKFYEVNLVYFEAQDLCKEKGGHVMEITSQAEEDIINELLPGNKIIY